MSNQVPQDDRVSLPEGNVFKYYQQNGMPEMDMNKTGQLDFKTAKEIEAERLASKNIRR